MIRKIFKARPNWKERCKAVGFDYFNLPSSDGSAYWSDEVGYEFTIAQVDHLDDSTNELHAMCMDVVRDLIARGDYHAAYGFSEGTKSLIEKSWNRGDKHLYGRFDFAYDGRSIKMLEYNADTPTSLLEASVVQWNCQPKPIQQHPRKAHRAVEGCRSVDRHGSSHPLRGS
jgi:glutathionylspermidine synthase